LILCSHDKLTVKSEDRESVLRSKACGWEVGKVLLQGDKKLSLALVCDVEEEDDAERVIAFEVAPARVENGARVDPYGKVSGNQAQLTLAHLIRDENGNCMRS
jgi:hypothetical protein